MRLTNELTVEAPLARTWAALLELGGPVTFDLGGPWSGRAHLDDADEDEHTAGFHLLGRERGGPGTAAATITARASGNGATTRVEVETDLRTTGTRPEPEAAQRTANELLTRLAATLQAAEPEPEPEPLPEPAPEPERAPPPEPPPTESKSAPLKGSDPLQVRKGSDPSVALDPVIVGGRVAERSLLVIAGIALGLGLGRLLRWRRR